MKLDRPILMLAEIETFDPGNSSSRRLCPLCGREKPRDVAHRSLSLEATTGKWKCFRCGNGGVLREFWQEQEKLNRLASSNHPFSPCKGRLKAFFPPQISTPAFGANQAQESDLKEASSTPAWRGQWESCVALENTRGATYLESRDIACEVAVLASARFHPTWSGALSPN